MNTYKKSNLFLRLSIVLFVLFFGISAYAVTPTLSVVGTGDGNYVQINVTGDPNVSVLLHYPQAGVGQQVIALGNTSSSGVFSTNLSSSSYGIVSGSTVHVTLNGLNGTASPEVSWPTVNTTSTTSTITLSQTGVVLSVGQSSTVTATNSGSGALYVSNNSNPATANVNISGNQITLTGNVNGSSVVTICAIGNTVSCPSIYVTVQNTGTSALTFSQSNVTIAPNQNVPISITGGTGVYVVLNNSNSSVVQSSISGSVITLSTTVTTGFASLTVCSSNMSACGIINVTASTTSGSSVSFSKNNPSMSIGQSTSVSIYGGSSNTYYVSSNSNPSVIQTSITNNSTLTLSGISNGSSVVTVCSSLGSCGSLTATVDYVASGDTLKLSQSSLSLITNQTISIIISGGTAPYSLPVSSNNIFQGSINANVLNIYGVSTGSTQIAVCSADGGCTSLSISVNGATSNTLPVGCSSNVGYSSTTGIPCNTVSSTTSLPVGCTTSTLFSPLTGQRCSTSTTTTTTTTPTTTTTSSTLCPNGMTYESNCTTAPVTTTTNTSGTLCPNGMTYESNCTTAPTTTTNTNTTTSSTVFKFTKELKVGSTGTDVIELQKKLSALGFYTGKIDGGFGPMTKKAVQAFQKANKLSQPGIVGPQTRALLNK